MNQKFRKEGPPRDSTGKARKGEKQKGPGWAGKTRFHPEESLPKWKTGELTGKKKG